VTLTDVKVSSVAERPDRLRAMWRRWTGLPFDTTGGVEVPGVLVPVRCEAERGYAVYVEPTVWMRHTV
jgi:hypothetical protein